MGASSLKRFLGSYPETHNFIRFLLTYDKSEWTSVDLQRDYPAYKVENAARLIAKLRDANIIRRGDYTIPANTRGKRYPLWRLNDRYKLEEYFQS